jgi:hypothetical protein
MRTHVDRDGSERILIVHLLSGACHGPIVVRRGIIASQLAVTECGKRQKHNNKQSSHIEPSIGKMPIATIRYFGLNAIRTLEGSQMIATRKLAVLALARYKECKLNGYSEDESRRNAIAFCAGAAVADKAHIKLFIRATMDGVDGITVWSRV